MINVREEMMARNMASRCVALPCPAPPIVETEKTPRAKRSLMSYLPLKLLCAVALCAAPLLAGVNAEGKAVLEALYKSYGGKERIAASRTLEQTGKAHSVMKNATYELERSYRYPDRLSIVKRDGTHPSEVRKLSGSEGWRDGTPVTGMLFDAMTLQAARMTVPLMLLENEANLRYSGLLKSDNGRSWHIFRIPLAKNGHLMVQVEPGSFLIRATAGIMPAANGGRLEFVTTYDRFERFGGLLVATKEQHYAMGNYVGWSEIAATRFPATLPDALFRP